MKTARRVDLPAHAIVDGALGGTRTPTILLTATSRQRVYQFRHERSGVRVCLRQDELRFRSAPKIPSGTDQGRHVTNQRWGDKARSTPTKRPVGITSAPASGATF